MPETEAYNQIQIQNHILGRIGKSCQLSGSTCSWDNLLSETDVLQDSSLLTSHGQPPHAHTLEYHSSVQFHVYSTVPPHCWCLFSHLTHPSRPSHGSQFSAAIDLDWITSGSPFFLHHNISSWEETDKVSESHLWVNPDTIQNFSDCVTALWGVGWGGARLLYFAWRVKIDLALSDLIMQSRRRLTDFWHKLSDVDALLSMRLLHIHIY